MPGRPHLSEEAEREDAEGRSRLRSIDSKLRELTKRRQSMLEDMDRLSDEQKELYDQRRPQEEALEGVHSEHRALGRRLSEVRRKREESRKRLEEAIVHARSFRKEVSKTEHPRPEQLKRELVQLEHIQQTRVLPIAEENALILRLRLLSRQLASAEKERGVFLEQEQRRQAREEEVLSIRVELDTLGSEFQSLRIERDRKMESMRARLLDVGQLVAGIREKAKARREVMVRVETTSREIVELEREGNRLLAQARERRQEARATVREFSRPAREEGRTDRARAATADAQLEELLKRGRVTLGG